MCIRSALEVGDHLPDTMTAVDVCYALLKLAADVGGRNQHPPPCRGEGSIARGVAEDASLCPDRPIPIWAAKAAIEADLIDPFPEV